MCLSVWLRDNFPFLSWRGVASMALAAPHCIRPCQHEEGAVSWELYQHRPVSPSPRGRECGGLVLFLPQHRSEAVMRGGLVRRAHRQLLCKFAVSGSLGSEPVLLV